MATATATVATAPFGGAAGRETEGRGESAASEGEETGASGRRRGVARRGRESVMTVKWFRRNTVGPLGWESEAMGSVVWVQCTNLCRVLLIYR